MVLVNISPNPVQLGDVPFDGDRLANIVLRVVDPAFTGDYDMTLVVTLSSTTAIFDVLPLDGWTDTGPAQFQNTIHMGPPAPGDTDSITLVPMALKVHPSTIPGDSIAGTLTVAILPTGGGGGGTTTPPGGPWNAAMLGVVVTSLDTSIAIELVLDRSLNMDQPIEAGSSVARTTRLRQAGERLLAMLTANDWLGAVRFRQAPQDLFTIQALSPAHRAAMASIFTPAATALKPDGGSAPGKAVAMARTLLGLMPPCSPAHRAIVLISDGNRNVADPPLPPSLIPTFAVGVGSPAVLNSAVLEELTTDNTFQGIIADPLNPSNVDFFQLEKYLLQVLASTTGLDVVIDPFGALSDDTVVEVPFPLTEADSNARVVLLTDDANLVDMVVTDPQRNDVDTTRLPGAGLVRTDGYFEVSLRRSAQIRPVKPVRDGKEAHYERGRDDDRSDKGRDDDRRRRDDERRRGVGTWTAKIALSRKARIQGTKLPSVRYSLVVLARSHIQLRSQVHADGCEVGSTAFITARLTEYGLPVDSRRAHVIVEITFPDGGKGNLELKQAFPGRFENSLRCALPGVYQFRVRAFGRSVYGSPYHREYTQQIRIQRTRCKSVGPELPPGDPVPPDSDEDRDSSGFVGDDVEKVPDTQLSAAEIDKLIQALERARRGAR